MAVKSRTQTPVTTSPLLPGCRGPVPKAYRIGTDRVVDPEQTLEWARPYLTKMGITRIANVTGLDRIGVPVVMVCRPNSRALAVSQGKGLTLAAAKASGLMESVETYHAERIDLPLKLGSYEELCGGHRLVDVTQLSHPRKSAFHPTLPLLWIEGYDLLQQEPVWIPYEMVHANFTTPRPSGSGCFSQTSNGLASGNHLLEAVSHGISEVVERDATTLWSLAGREAQQLTRLDLRSVDDPSCCEVLDKLERAGMVVAVWETTSDTGVPSYLCLFADPSGAALGHVHHYRGYGCHATHRLGLLRALTEAVQMRLTIISGSRDDLDPIHYRLQSQHTGASLELDWLEASGPLRKFRETPECDADTFDEEVAWQLELLRAAGIERVVAVDLTKPSLGLPVVRVVVPGLETAFMDMKYFALGDRARRLCRRV
jgi:YcaO-like protein with predicted kinase domain